MSILRQAVINASWLASDRLLRLTLNFIVGILIARHYGPEALGLFSYGQLLVMILMPVATFGMSEILVREFSSEQRDPEALLVSALIVRLALSLFALILILGLALLLRGPNWAVIVVVFGYGLSYIPQSFEVVENRFQSLNRVGVLSTLRIGNGVLFTLLRIAALVLVMPIETYAYLYSAEIGLFALLSVIAGWRQGIRIASSRVSWNEARFLLKVSTPLMVRTLVIAIYMRIDQLMVQHYLGDEKMGVYSAAVRITELWYFIPAAIVVGAAPNLTRLYHEDEEAYTGALRQLMRMLVLLAIVPAVCFTIGASFIINLLFGPAYAAAAPVLAVQTWAGVFVAMSVATYPWFINSGQLRFTVYQALAGVLAGVALNAILIPRFGMIGAAISMVISYGISVVALNAAFTTTRGLFVMQIKALTLR